MRTQTEDPAEELARETVANLLLVAAIAIAVGPLVVGWITRRITLGLRASGIPSLIAVATTITAVITAAFALDPGEPGPVRVVIAIAATAGLLGAMTGATDRRLLPDAMARRLGWGTTRRGTDPAARGRAKRRKAATRRAEKQIARLDRDPDLWVPGVDDRGTPVSLDVIEATGHHALILGATGSGKTTLIRGLIAAWLKSPERGAVIAIDCKGDPDDLARPLAAMAEHAERPSWTWARDQADTIDPFSDGTPADRVGRIVEAYDWSEAHYQAMALAYLHETIAALDADERGADIHTLAEAIRNPGSVSADLEEAFALDGAEGGRVRQGLAGRLRAWSLSEGAEHARTGGTRLSEILDQSGALSVSIPAAADPAQVSRWAQLFSRGVLQAATGGGRPTLLVIDEAQFAGGDALKAILQQGRGLGVFAVLAFQEGATAYEVLGPAWSNPQTLIAGRQGDAESSELVAGLFGTERRRRVSWQVEGGWRERYTGAGSEVWEDAFSVHPQLLRSLELGEFEVRAWGRLLTSDRSS